MTEAMIKRRETCDYSAQFDSCVSCMMAARFCECRAKTLEKLESEVEELMGLDAPGKFRSVADMCNLCGPSGKIAYNIVERDLSLVPLEKCKELSTATRVVYIPCPNCNRVGYLRGKRYIAMLQYPRSAFAMRESLDDFDWSRFMDIFQEKREYYRKRNRKMCSVDMWLRGLMSDIDKMRESGAFSDSTLESLDRACRNVELRENKR